MSFALYPVKYVDPKTLVDELKDVLLQTDSPLEGLVRLIPLNRLKTVVVASPRPEALPKIGDWIRRLDMGESSEGRRVYVYDVQNGKAGDLAATIGRMFGISTPSIAQGPNSSPTSTNPSVPVPQPGALIGSQGGQGWMQQPSSVGTLGSQGNTRAPEATLDNVGVRVVPSEENNALLILAKPTEYSVLEAALLQLDVPPRQVMIEVSLAEVSLNNDLKFGIQWKIGDIQGTATNSQTASGILAQSFPGLSYIYTGSQSIQAVLNTLESVTKVKVISSPKLLVLNNHQATIQVGDQVPILTQQAVSTEQTNAPIVNSVTQRDTGVILHVTPRVNKSGSVILEIDQEVSAVVPNSTSGIDSPTIQERKLSSTVALQDGQTAALGGLIREISSDGRSGLPFLQHIPLIGPLFAADTHSSGRIELIVLITPHVIRDERQMQGVVEDLEEQFRTLRNGFHLDEKIHH